MIQQLRVIESLKKQKNFQQILMKKKAVCKTQNFYILLAFLLITTLLLIAVVIYCYLIKDFKSIHYHFLITNNELKKYLLII